MQKTDVIVVGGGPVGLGLAIELGQRGINVLVLEAYHEPQPVPKGQNLTQRTMEHFRHWGAESELRAAQPIPAEACSGGLTAYGNLASGHYYDWLQRNLVGEFYATANARLPQYETEAVLRNRIAEIPNVTLLTGWRASAVTQADDSVTVTAHNREKEQERCFCAKFLVGCDGSNSIIRDSAKITQTMADHDRLMVLLVFHSPGFDSFLERFENKCFFNVLNPDLEGYWQFFGRVDQGKNFFFHAPVPASAREGDYDFAGLLQQAAGTEFTAEITYCGFWDLRFAIADNYRQNRIFIAGDAAHSHPPYGGYGINTGFEDARNLGWKLAAFLQGWGSDALLDSYHQERHAIFASTARDFIAKSISTDADFLARFDPERNSADFEKEWLGRATGAREEVHAYAPHYLGSSVIWSTQADQSSAKGEHRWDAAPGLRLPHVKLDSDRMACELTGESFTLFTREANLAASFTKAAEARLIPLTCVVDGAAALKAGHVLVRPDQFIAWTADTGDQINPSAVLDHVTGLIARPLQTG